MENNKFNKAMEIFETPLEFYEEAKLMLNEEEIELILLMKENLYTEDMLIKLILDKKISDKPFELIKSGYGRSVLNKVDKNGVIHYKLANFYGRFPFFAQYEYDSYALIARERKEALNDWDKKIYIGVYGDDVRAKMKGQETHVHNSDFLTLDESFKFVDKFKDLIYMIPCNCKCMMFYHDKPLNVCMNFDTSINSHYDRGHGEVISSDEAKKRLVEFNKKGLMQNGEDYEICNCDGYACYPLHMAGVIGSKGSYPKSNYIIEWHEEECVNCGKCTKICNFGAFYFDENKHVKFDVEKCWGCTICTNNCPKDAIKLIKKS
jgi:NAD-dependent dihydropyrimidine dehydrogenase PreA subunit